MPSNEVPNSESKRGLIIPKRLLSAVDDENGEEMSFFADSSLVIETTASSQDDDKNEQHDEKASLQNHTAIDTFSPKTQENNGNFSGNSGGNRRARGHAQGHRQSQGYTQNASVGDDRNTSKHHDRSSGGNDESNEGNIDQNKPQTERWIASPDDLDDEALIQALRNQRDRNLVLQVEAELYNYVNSAMVTSDGQPLFYPHLSNPFHRLLVHHMADRFNLSHMVVGGATPYIIIKLTENTTVPDVMLGALVNMYPNHFELVSEGPSFPQKPHHWRDNNATSISNTSSSNINSSSNSNGNSNSNSNSNSKNSASAEQKCMPSEAEGRNVRIMRRRGHEDIPSRSSDQVASEKDTDVEGEKTEAEIEEEKLTAYEAKKQAIFGEDQAKNDTELTNDISGGSGGVQRNLSRENAADDPDYRAGRSLRGHHHQHEHQGRGRGDHSHNSRWRGNGGRGHGRYYHGNAMMYDQTHNFFPGGAPWMHEGMIPQAYMDASTAFQQHQQLMMQYPMMYPMNVHPAMMLEQQYPPPNAQMLYMQTGPKGVANLPHDGSEVRDETNTSA